VALGRMRARKVLARMRSMTPRVFRRLLLVGGLALAGWLLCGAGQAHAAADDGLDPGAGAAALGSLPYAGAPAKTLAPGHTGRRVAATADRPRAIARESIAGESITRESVSRGGVTRDVSRDGIARSVIGTAVRSGDLVSRTGALDPVATLPTGRVGTGAGWAPRHRTDAVPGDSAAATRHGRPTTGPAHRGVVRPAASAAATGTGRFGHAHARTAPATPAPPAGLPRGAAGETGALPSAGFASAGGLAGHTARPEVAPRRSSSLRSVLGAVPPVVHTATDEPAVSPD
jgi:hypothetical protein